ncbi:MAG: phosphate starvation-inducible protein PsiF [Rhodocyclaceae bacterium]|nr:phosphate starvation-inducible protein PsiF [Rhodocyclaceae bacterium]
MNKKLLMSLAAGVLLACSMASGPALAGAQQEKMKQCNQDAKGKTGDERRAFMKECLSAGKPAAADNKSAQQEKMKMCNEKATGKKGDERRAFMKECLKG